MVLFNLSSAVTGLTIGHSGVFSLGDGHRDSAEFLVFRSVLTDRLGVCQRVGYGAFTFRGFSNIFTILTDYISESYNPSSKVV